jgi:lysyl-tRNA synthetase class 2
LLNGLSLQKFYKKKRNMRLTEQEIVRRNALQELRKLGINPYPQAEYKVNAHAKEITRGLV